MKLVERVKETAHSILGVAGRMYPRIPSVNGERYAAQKWVSKQRPFREFGNGAWIQCEIRFDDQCHNGHQSFAITGEVRKPGQHDSLMCGCIHDEIAKAFPELAPLIKWHLCSTDGPMHYIGNTCYLAGNRDHSGRLAGDPASFDTVIQFGDFPIKSHLPHKFVNWLKSLENYDLEIMVVHYKPCEGDTYRFKPKYTFLPFAADTWHAAPFDTEQEACEFLQALQQYPVRFIDVPTSFSDGKASELDRARRVALWPEATDEQLSVPCEELKKVLEERLPTLLVQFRAELERCGFIWA